MSCVCDAVLNAWISQQQKATGRSAVTDTTCPNGQTCSGTQTCCATSSGQYGCCPYTSATCCSDDTHCCPNGYTCDLSKGQCVQAPNLRLRALRPAFAPAPLQ